MSKQNVHSVPNMAIKYYKLFGFATCFVLLSLQPQAQTAPKAYQVKAAFLYNFSQFVEWPPTAFSNQASPFVIGILGKDPFGAYLHELVKGERINGHPIQVQRYGDEKEIKNCHILFINLPSTINALSALENQSTLTVSDADNFARQGGMIRFFTENNKIRLEINPAAAKEASLNISSKLLRVAQIVER